MPAPFADINGDQFSLTDIKLLVLVYFPFMESFPAQTFAFVLFRQSGPFKRQNSRHASLRVYQRVIS